MFVEIIVLIVLVYMILYLYWRFFHFFRDPEREIPQGNNVVAPADGTVVYIRKIEQSKIPVAEKKGTRIKLSEISKIKQNKEFEGGYIIGTYMSPMNVHVNRAPIAGKVQGQFYFTNKNVPMVSKGQLYAKLLLNKTPKLLDREHVLQNERNTISIKGKDISVVVVQIADRWVSKIISYIKKGQSIKKGQRIGQIRMGSQVDLIMPKHLRILVKEGQRVKAGLTIMAEITLT